MVRPPHGVLKDIGADSKGVLESVLVLNQRAAGFVRLKEPLVRVQPDRISAFNPAQELSAPLRHDGEAAICGVDMQPEILRRAKVGHRLETVDGAGACRAGVCGDRDGREAGVAVVGHGAGQRAHVQAEVRVARDHANALAADADDHRRTGEGAVALIAHVDGGALGMACRLARRDEGVDTGDGAAAGEEPARAFRPRFSRDSKLRRSTPTGVRSLPASGTAFGARIPISIRAVTVAQT